MRHLAPKSQRRRPRLRPSHVTAALLGAWAVQGTALLIAWEPIPDGRHFAYMLLTAYLAVRLTTPTVHRNRK